MTPSLGTPCAAVVASLAVVLLSAAGPCRSSVFDECERAATGNVTAAECVGKLVLDTLTKASEDPKGFFEANVSTALSVTAPGWRRSRQTDPRSLDDCRLSIHSNVSRRTFLISIISTFNVD